VGFKLQLAEYTYAVGDWFYLNYVGFKLRVLKSKTIRLSSGFI